MEWFEALALLLGTIIVLMAIGMPVALAFLAANILGAWVFMGGERGIIQLLNNGLGSLTKYALVPIPLFLLMGEVFFHTGLGGRMFNAIDKLLGRLPGRLSYVTVLGGTAFSTLSGSSMGSTALLGSLMVPEMAKRGYKPHMSIGPILGTGGLAIIIPPSALAVLLATLTVETVGQRPLPNDLRLATSAQVWPLAVLVNAAELHEPFFGTGDPGVPGFLRVPGGVERLSPGERVGKRASLVVAGALRKEGSEAPRLPEVGGRGQRCGHVQSHGHWPVSGIRAPRQSVVSPDAARKAPTDDKVVKLSGPAEFRKTGRVPLRSPREHSARPGPEGMGPDLTRFVVPIAPNDPGGPSQARDFAEELSPETRLPVPPVRGANGPPINVEDVEPVVLHLDVGM